MSDQNLETQMGAIFAEPEVFPDAAKFAARTQRKLRRGRRMRRLLLILIGTAASLLSAYLLNASGVVMYLVNAVDAMIRATRGFGFYWVAVAALAVLTACQMAKSARDIDV